MQIEITFSDLLWHGNGKLWSGSGEYCVIPVHLQLFEISFLITTWNPYGQYYQAKLVWGLLPAGHHSAVRGEHRMYISNFWLPNFQKEYWICLTISSWLKSLSPDWEWEFRKNENASKKCCRGRLWEAAGTTPWATGCIYSVWIHITGSSTVWGWQVLTTSKSKRKYFSPHPHFPGMFVSWLCKSNKWKCNCKGDLWQQPDHLSAPRATTRTFSSSWGNNQNL